jgi:hypothetical protein
MTSQENEIQNSIKNLIVMGMKPGEAETFARDAARMRHETLGDGESKKGNKGVGLALVIFGGIALYIFLKAGK